jgi:hypothetical protein
MNIEMVLITTRYLGTSEDILALVKMGFSYKVLINCSLILIHNQGSKWKKRTVHYSKLSPKYRLKVNISI